MTADEIERIGQFVKALNKAERDYNVFIELTPGPEKYLRLVPGYPHRVLQIEPHVGGADLELVRPDDL